MPEGIIATVDGGFATIDFVDRSLRGPALAELIEAGGPGIVETITRSGPRTKYRVPVGNAEDAGLIDEDTPEGKVPVHYDSGTAAALAAAQAAQIVAGATTRPDMPTSANKYVGTTSAAAERALAPSPYSGNPSGGYGGTNAGETPSHREIIDYVKDNGPVLAQARGVDPQFGATAFEVNSALAGIYAGDEGTAPGAEYIEGGQASSEFTANPVVQDVTATQGATAVVGDDAPVVGGEPVIETSTEPTTPADPEELVEYPQGEPSDKWLRSELDAYALKVKGLDTTGLGNKTEVLAAINAPSQA